ncbi:hypothetical protein [Rufibacter sp. XAAS-G3-1]|uniref:hypothetical protein n=1 Tax=Rufibacter sp. XAAS-G3-1 TaxID=2729134 RepID=UPI00351A6217
MRTFATLQEADSGSIRLGDLEGFWEKDEMRKVLGCLPQEFGVYPKVSAEELLDYFAVLKGVHNSKERKETVASLLQQTNLYEVRKKNLGGYSGGTKQQYIHYRKGSVAMYALADYIGEDKLNAALKEYVQKVAFQQAPYTNSVECMRLHPQSHARFPAVPGR